MQRILVLALSLSFCASVVSAQGLDVRELAVLKVTGGGGYDDILVEPSGAWLVANIANSTIDRIDLASPQPISVLVAGVKGISMAFAPDGSLWIGDGISGDVLRYDFALQTLQTMVTDVDLQAPVDIAFDGAQTLYVADVNSNFPDGPSEIRRYDLGGLQPVAIMTPQPLLGAPDIEVGPLHEIYVTERVGGTLSVIDPMTLQKSLLITGLIGPSDVVLGPNSSLLVVSSGFAELFRVDLNGLTSIVRGLTTGATGSGAEDIALTANGNALVTSNVGDIYEVDLSSPFRQVGTAAINAVIDFDIDFSATPNLAQLAGKSYFVGGSASALNGIPFQGQVLPLDNDIVFQVVATRPYICVDFDGQLDAAGRAQATLALGVLPGLIGFRFYFAAAVYDLVPVTGVLLLETTNAATFVIAP